MGDYGLSAMFRIYESILNIKKKKVQLCIKSVGLWARAGPDKFGALDKVLAGGPCITANSTTIIVFIHSHRKCIFHVLETFFILETKPPTK